MTRQELIITGGLLLDYMAILSKELLESDSRTNKVYLKEKIEKIKETVRKIGEDINGK